ncbi:hypothetical protein O2W14_07790 [Modestobacter sp. VKM Ac-2986]|uniref:hypothetical protein n=1 Tax=Modestobacter sp. VKM Ac-2986 TaxID=3004140 RepID=UPI0022AAEDD5|nr:hypothetical protein [Modestobacter sp. VKM Ac-2986]MCZ2828728.1 hypothetical protein [Modestobacter sp. VKM Ac-2986]
MTHSIDTPTPSAQSGATPVSTGSPSTKDVAKDQAGTVASTAASAGSQVASTAADQAKQVTQETKRQAQDLIAQGRTQVTSQLQDQARNGQLKASEGLEQIAQQLRTMVSGSGETPTGPAADLVTQAGDKVEELASWLQSREPGDLLVEARNFARRRPGAFILGAAVAGILAGRLTTGVVAAHKDASPSTGTTPLPATPSYGTTNYAAETTATGYADAGYAGTTSGYATTGTTGSVPPPPYGTTGTTGTSGIGGFDDPARTSGPGQL